ncbi:MAG: hypothetical protein QM793_01565 [Muricomes sp.]
MLIRIMVSENNSDSETEIREVYAQFEKTEILCPDMEYWMGFYMVRQGKFQDGVYWLELALKKMEGYSGNDTLYITSNLEEVYQSLAEAHKELGNLSQSVRYGTITLRGNKKQEKPLLLLLNLFAEDKGTTASAAYQFLSKLYDFSDLRDRLFVLKQAKIASYLELEEELFSTMTQEEQEWLKEKSDISWQLSAEDMRAKYPDTPILNRIDYNFLTIMECADQLSEEELINRMRGSLSLMKKETEGDYQLLLAGINSSSLLGGLSPESDKYAAFCSRAQTLKQHREELLWLYNIFEDNRSRQALYGILENWVNLEKRVLSVVKEGGVPYFDLDIIPSCNQSIFVDVGAKDGKGLNGFLYSYGEEYHKIYCFESNKEELSKLKDIISENENVVLLETEAGKYKSG